MCIEKIFMGLDLSLNSTGVAYSVDSKIFTLAIVPISKKESQIEKISRIIKTIDLIVVDLLKKNENISIYAEGVPFINRNGNQTLSEIMGCMKLMLWDNHKILLNVVNNKTWKKDILGNGGAKKELITNLVKILYKKEFKTQDECDAFCVMKFAEKS